jgi:hypothetical protein
VCAWELTSVGARGRSPESLVHSFVFVVCSAFLVLRVEEPWIDLHLPPLRVSRDEVNVICGTHTGVREPR